MTTTGRLKLSKLNLLTRVVVRHSLCQVQGLALVLCPPRHAKRRSWTRPSYLPSAAPTTPTGRSTRSCTRCTCCWRQRQRSRINAEKRLDFLITERKKTESKLGDKLSEMRSYLTRAQAMREKLRVIKLLNVVTDSGHTALSWAAAYGQYDTVDLMLRTGASPGNPTL